MAVFTKAWVERNLSEFLDGDTASPIVTLGEEAIEAKDEESRLEQEMTRLRAAAGEADKKRKDSSDRADQIARKAQDAIASQLREFDYQRFSKNRYSMPTVEGMLNDHKGDFPDESRAADSLKRLAEGAAERVPQVSVVPATNASSFDGLADLLAETPVRAAISAIEADPKRQTWVEEGLVLHEELDNCLFCAGQITPERRDALASHFDESWLRLRQRATGLRAEVLRARDALGAWQDALIQPDRLCADVRDGYAVLRDAAMAAVASRLSVLEDVVGVLQEKARDPSVEPLTPDVSLLSSALTVAGIQEAIAEHNKQADEHAEVTEGHVTTVLDHIVGCRSEPYKTLRAQAAVAAGDVSKNKDAVRLLEAALTEVRQKQFSSARMADTLTNDLARVYGKDHLSVTVTEDGKSYVCKRGDAPATHLSDGERTTLSLLYFLRKLEDETVSGDKSTRIVVVDDPSSSLDREALFATHQWLVDTLKGFGQFVVLTHDFGLLRLFINSQGSAWGNSQNKIKKGDSEEKRFPAVSFLEMYAATQEGGRLTQVAHLPSMLRIHTTEYAYLFRKVMDGIADGTDHDRLFLLPNAARRVLEVFTSYKVPHLGTFDQRLAGVMDSSDGNANPYRDVYDFCNRYSHGEGSESVDVLDARAVYGQIRRCMEFLRHSDQEHFDRMCKATGVEVPIF
jgi:wobble nucleotide-excising tRNase